MSQTYPSSVLLTFRAARPAARTSTACFWPQLKCWPRLLLTVLALTLGSTYTHATDLFGAGTPVVVDGGNPTPVVLGVKIFSDVAGQVLGCSFYKSAANTGTHVVSLWDATGKLLASKVATGETASGKQTVLFSSPIPIAAKQAFVCGYFAPAGHFSYDHSTFVAQKDVPPLHVPINGGLYTYGTQSTVLPTSSCCFSSNYWVDVRFSTSTTGSTTWISGLSVEPSRNGASVSWTTAIPSDSQVEYGPTTAYGNTTPVAAGGVTAHAAALSGLVPGTVYHLRARSRDSDGVVAVGLDATFAPIAPVIVVLSPTTATVASSGTQQLMATVSSTANPAVTWSTTAGSVNSSGMFTAPSVSTPTSVTVTATSQSDPSKSAFVTLTVNPAAAAVLSVSPSSLTFSAQAGSSPLPPASVSITNTGAGSLTFTGASDQPWLMLSASSGTAPSTLQVSPSATGLKAGIYTGHVTVAGGGVTRTVTVAMTVTAAAAQYTVALAWKRSISSAVVSYSMYRSTIAGKSYALISSAIGGPLYSDAAVQSGMTYYYVVTSVDSTGRESANSNEMRVLIP
jgi:hypothetical protein